MFWPRRILYAVCILFSRIRCMMWIVVYGNCCMCRNIHIETIKLSSIQFGGSGLWVVEWWARCDKNKQKITSQIWICDLVAEHRCDDDAATSGWLAGLVIGVNDVKFPPIFSWKHKTIVINVFGEKQKAKASVLNERTKRNNWNRGNNNSEPNKQ